MLLLSLSLVRHPFINIDTDIGRGIHSFGRIGLGPLNRRTQYPRLPVPTPIT